MSREKLTLRKPMETTEDTVDAFVLGLLSGGPMRRNAVYQEAEGRRLDWDRVIDAFRRLNGREYIDRGETMWRIYPA